MYGQPTQYGQPLLGPPGMPPPNLAAGLAMGAQQGMGMGMGPPPMMPQPNMIGGGMIAPPINTLIINTGGSKCPFCNDTTGTIPRLAVGCVTWSWCVGLLFLTGWCCFIPFCVDSCKDVQQVCERCSNVKGVIPANCC